MIDDNYEIIETPDEFTNTTDSITIATTADTVAQEFKLQYIELNRNADGTGF